MGFWSKVCCCGDNKEFDIEDENRILPKLKSDSSSIQKYESPYTIFAYGLVPPDLQMLKIPMEFCREGITKISCGAEHFMMLTENNYLLAAGNNTYGQCARDPDKPLTRDFAKYHEESSEKLDKETPKFIRLKAFNIPNSKVSSI